MIDIAGAVRISTCKASFVVVAAVASGIVVVVIVAAVEVLVVVIVAPCVVCELFVIVAAASLCVSSVSRPFERSFAFDIMIIVGVIVVGIPPPFFWLCVLWL